MQMATPKEVLVTRAFQVALRFISYRPRSRREIRGRLLRGFQQHDVEQALERLEKQGYVDDAMFARFWSESREAHRPKSAGLVRWELVQRGVCREVADEAVASLDDDSNAYRAGLVRVRKLGPLDYLTFRRRLDGYLKRRGFRPETTRRAIEQLWRERAS